jgi:hypothetical protein
VFWEASGSAVAKLAHTFEDVEYAWSAGLALRTSNEGFRIRDLSLDPPRKFGRSVSESRGEAELDVRQACSSCRSVSCGFVQVPSLGVSGDWLACWLWGCGDRVGLVRPLG